MKYAKIGLGVAVGWYFGKVVFDFSREFVTQLARRYISEKYWNLHHPDNPIFGCINRPNGSENTSSEIRIGFSAD